MWSAIRPNARNIRFWQVGVLLAVFAFWHVMTKPGLIPPMFFDNDRQAAFFFGEPVQILARIWEWFITDRDIYGHLWVTLVETVLAFVIGTVAGLAVGMWLALSPVAAAILDPYIKAANSMPRVILAPIFAVWFGLGIASKVALGFTLVFFIVFFNVLAPRVGRPGVRRCGGGGVSRFGPGCRLSDSSGRGHVRHQHRDGRHPGAYGLRPGAGLGRGTGRAPPHEVAAEERRDGEALDGAAAGQPAAPVRRPAA